MLRPFHLRTLAAAFLAVLTVAAVSAQGHAQPADRPAFGLIVGYHAAANELQADRGPWAAGREQAQAHWSRAADRSREHTARLAHDVGLKIQGVGEAGNAALLRFEKPLKGRELEDALRRVRLHPDVAWVEPNVLLQRLETVPNDPDYAQQWHLKAPAVGGTSAINLPPAWDLTTGSAGITVAVLDTGILPHPDLVGRHWPGYDFVTNENINGVNTSGDGDGRDPDPTDPGDWVTPDEATVLGCEADDSSWHGTFIAGQIAAATNNGRGIAGVNWASKVLPVRVSGKCGAFLSDVLDGMRWAAGMPVAGVPVNAHPARIINLSFGGDRPCSENPAYQQTIDAVTSVGSLVVVAGGNRATQLTRPADCQRVLSVGAVRKDGLKTSYSSYGPTLGLMAPGGSTESGNATLLYATSNSGKTAAVAGENYFDHKQGTSFSAPLASGVASLMLSLNPALSPAQLVDRMRAGVRPWSDIAPGYATCRNDLPPQGPCKCTTDTCGPGLLDAGLAIKLALGPAAVIAPLDTVTPGATITLDGSASAAIPGSRIVRHQWTQEGGPSVAIGNADQPIATVRLPSSPATYVFRLTVTDDHQPSARTGSDTLTAVAAYPVSSGGGGASGWLWGMALWAWVVALGLRQRRWPSA